MQRRSFNACLLCCMFMIAMLVGLFTTAFVVSDYIVKNAIIRVQEMEEQAVLAYQTAIGQYGGQYADKNNEDDIILQHPTESTPNTDIDDSDSPSDNTEDGRPSVGADGDVTVDINDGNSDSDDVPIEDPVVENTGWDDSLIFVEHMVAYGDTLTDIAVRYGVSAYDIAEFNGIDNMNKIRIGQILLIPLVDDWNLV